MRISDWSSDVCSSDLDLVASAGEVNDSNRRIATAAGQAREKASATAKSVRNSEETVRNAVTAIHALVEAVSVIEGQLTGLPEALSQVAQVAQGIDAIAKQTNLLALTAPTEAARAAQTGKGPCGEGGGGEGRGAA